MKTQTPKQWLLERHEPADGELDRLRRAILEGGVPQTTSATTISSTLWLRPVAMGLVGAGLAAAVVMLFRPGAPGVPDGSAVRESASPKVIGAASPPTGPTTAVEVANPVPVSTLPPASVPMAAQLSPAEQQVEKLKEQLEQLKAGSAGIQLRPVSTPTPEVTKQQQLSDKINRLQEALAQVEQQAAAQNQRDASRTASTATTAQAGATNTRTTTSDPRLDQRLLEQRLQDAASRSTSIMVSGQVNKPGAVTPKPPAQAMTAWQPAMSLADAIAAAGGLTQSGNGGGIAVVRAAADGSVQTFGPLNVRTESGRSFQVLPGDSVQVPMRVF